MSTNTAIGQPSSDGKDTYLELVKQFRLQSIRDDEDLSRAQEVLDQLLGREPLDEGEENYLSALSDLIEHYEEHHVKLPPSSDADILNYLLDVHSLTQNQLAEELGVVKSTISAILSGRRKLTRQQINRIAERFDISRDTFYVDEDDKS